MMKAQLICSLKGTSTRQIWETFGLTLKLECINHIKHWFYLSNADRSSLNMQFSYLFLCRLFITAAFFFLFWLTTEPFPLRPNHLKQLLFGENQPDDVISSKVRKCWYG